MAFKPEHTSAGGVRPAERHGDPYPVVTVDASGRVLSYNERAGSLLTRISVGAALSDVAPPWLVEAHLEQAGRAGRAPSAWAAGRICGRRVEALAGPGADGAVTWWLVGDSAPPGTARKAPPERRRSGPAAPELFAELPVAPDAEHCAAAIVTRAVRHLADAAVVVGTCDGPAFPVIRCAAGRPVEQERTVLDTGRPAGLAEALQGLPTLSSRWIDPQEMPSWAIPRGFVADAAEVGSVVVLPLPGHGASAGCLILLRHRREAAFTSAEESLAQSFAARAGVALSVARSRARQARGTEVLLRDLLPPALGPVHGICFSGRYRASTADERVGGDFYDLHPAATPRHETVVVLGDVCGKGLEAAVTGGRIRHALRALLPFAADHTRLLTLLNSALLTAPRTPFATLVLVTAVRRDAQVRLRISGAGHPPPLVVRTTGRVEEVGTGGMLIGAFTDPGEFGTAEVVLRPGETCLLYSDGITEARGGPLGDAMFGEGRLRTVLARCAGMPAEVVTERVLMIADQWVGEGRRDDMAVLAITAPRDVRSTSPGATAPKGEAHDR
ncbi:GAF domain-containing SpoIIE family protein phosphatase [Streptomyces sp. CRN 30]|uniref:PP2C family protein-serine/threonine phosphatase n=1 Tax=Streptomyces sp. CRN 30 TaxID=3075613 RepID=UPI002A7F8F29|nr:GAF domain-containing SpoIIE family protein phosphatase [Streptomyces sp. CRN 30]